MGETPHERILGCDRFEFIAVSTDGKVRRVIDNGTLEPTLDHFQDGAKSKDVVVDTDTSVFVRIFLPEVAEKNPQNKLPVFFYVHGGGFSIESAASPVYHRYLSKLAHEVGLVCVSVNFRLCPEHRLPVAYDDSFTALQWLLSGPGRTDAWIAAHGDMGRVFIAGDSSGGNIVHEIGVRASRAEWGSDVVFEGGIAVHPFFQEKLNDGEGSEEAREFLRGRNEFMLEVCLPEGEDIYEYPPFNPVGPRSPPVSELVFKRMLVAVADKDVLREIGLGYYRALCDGGKDVELFFSEKEGHCFHLMDVNSPSAVSFMDRLRSFVHP